MKQSLLAAALVAFVLPSWGQYTEKLNRAPVAVATESGIQVSWRSLQADAADMSFTVRQAERLVAENVTDVTTVMDSEGKAGDVYTITSSTGESFNARAWDNIYRSISIPRPSGIKSGNTTGRYRPDDISVGDVDGDGEYEWIVKWMPDNARDNGSDGYSSPCILDCYKVNPAMSAVATQLWRINLGPNIRSGNHYTPFIVYDLDGDGRAEVVVKTAPGSKDGKGNYVSAAATDAAIRGIDNSQNLVNSKGRILTGEELLTVFNGATGAAMHTIWYQPNRAFGVGNGSMSYGSWGDSSGNRGERFNACVAHLDGVDKRPSAIMQRGYYTRTYLWAVDWDGTSLQTRWLHRSTSATAWDVVDATGNVVLSNSGKSAYGQGVHSISVGDVDGDGLDEICIGSATIDHNGALLCSTGMGHGDAIHLGHLVAGRAGMQVMMPHEEKNSVSTYGFDVHDAATGEILVHQNGTADNGRGLAGDFIPSNAGWEFWSSADGNTYNCADGTVVTAKKADTNFRIYWTGDPYDQTFDGRYDSGTGKCSPRIRNWKKSGSYYTFMEFAAYGAPQTVNTTKATPCLQADLFGDWREEIIMVGYESDWSASTCTLMLFSTPEPTAYKVPCLMQDHLYRMGIVWQNSSYNQPPHLGYDLAAWLKVDGSKYANSTENHAPEATPPTPPSTGEESLVSPSADKAEVKGTCYTAGKNGEITDQKSGDYLKIRTNINDKLIFYVNEGYVITGLRIEAYSNNKSTLADRSIGLTGVYVDDDSANRLPGTVNFPGGTAGQTPVTAEVLDLDAKAKIELTFDNSRIVTGTEDANGKNKQIFAKVTFVYKLAEKTAIETVTIDANGRIYNLMGQEMDVAPFGQIYIENGKKKIRL